MTSGQGGGQPPYGEQPAPEQPPAGQPPAGYPPYGQPPPGYPPYGQPPPGYLPAPAAPRGWGQDAPRAVDRPVTVRAALGAFIASTVLSVVGSVVTFLNWDLTLNYIVAQTQRAQPDTGSVPFDPEQFAGLILRVGIVVSIVAVALDLLFIWFAWKGYNWARIVLWVLGGLGVVFGLYGRASGSAGAPFPFVTALGWFQWLFVAVGIVLLALAPSSEWYRYRKWLRLTGQPG